VKLRTFEELQALDLRALQEVATEAAVDVSAPEFIEQVQRRMAAVDETYQPTTAQETEEPSVVYRGARKAIAGIGQFTMLAIMAALSYMLPPAAVAFLAVLEQHRVRAAVALIDSANADLMATVTVATYLTLLVIQTRMLKRDGALTRPRWSLRTTWRNLMYLLGIGRGWEERKPSPLEYMQAATDAVQLFIIAAGAFGTLASSGLLNQYPDPWHVALGRIFTESQSEPMGVLVLTVGYVWALLRATHFTVSYGYWRYAGLMGAAETGNLDFFDGGGPSVTVVELKQDAARHYLIRRILKAQERRMLTDGK